MTDRAIPQPSLRRRLAAPVDIASIVVFRAVFGGVMLWEAVRYFAHGWIREHYLAPAFHFTYPGFEWLRPLPGMWLYLHFAMLGVLAFAIAVGFYYRVAVALFGAGFLYVFLLELARYQNHFYLICLISLILVCIPANGAASLDARLRPSVRRDAVPAWMLWLLRFQIGVPFFFGGIAKLNHDWLQGEPMRTWLRQSTDIPLVGPLLAEEGAVWVFSYGGVVFDLLIVPLLMWRPTRLWAWLANVLFHLMNAHLFQIGIFPWFMIGATTIYFEPDWPRRLARRLGQRDPLLQRAAVPPRVSTTAVRPLPTALLTAYVGLQLILPFRHLLYPGDASWTMEGDRFAWRMRLAQKLTGIRFHLYDPLKGRRWTHDPNRVLPRWLVDTMSVHPEMIRQYAHFVADQYRRELGRALEVRAYVANALNGRRPELLVDPDVDLAQQQLSWGAASWIRPLTEPLPPPSERWKHLSLGPAPRGDSERRPPVVGGPDGESSPR